MPSRRVELLQSMSIFGGIRDDIVEFIVGRAPSVRVSAGHCFFREGDTADSMFVLETGEAAVLKGAEGHVLRRVAAGECFGEMSLIDLQPRSASVRAITDCTALRVSSACLYDVYARDVEQFAMIEMNMGREVSRRMRQLDAAFDALAGDAAMPGSSHMRGVVPSAHPSPLTDIYYGSDLAWVHHTGYSHHVERTWRGIVALLERGGVAAGAHVLDVGCGSGLLARRLLDAGYAVTGIDASAAMIELARRHAPGATFAVVRLPTDAAQSAGHPLPRVDAVVSTGHVLNYLATREDITMALREIAHALRPAGVLAMDLITDACLDQSDSGDVHAKVTDDWAIITRFVQPESHRLDRMITVFRRTNEQWRRSDEHHRNLTFDADEALRILRDNGIEAEQRGAYGDETLPQGLVVVTGIRRG